MWHQGGFGMTPATIDLSGYDSDIRANVLRQLTASGLSEQVFVNQVYHALAGGQFSLLDLLGPNAGTLEAMQELADGRGVTAENIEELFVDLHADDWNAQHSSKKTIKNIPKASMAPSLMPASKV